MKLRRSLFSAKNWYFVYDFDTDHLKNLVKSAWQETIKSEQGNPTKGSSVFSILYQTQISEKLKKRLVKFC
jgi:hypothetical protein